MSASAVGAKRRCDGKRAGSHEQEAATPEPVAERTGRHEAARHEKRVAVDDPQQRKAAEQPTVAVRRG